MGYLVTWYESNTGGRKCQCFDDYADAFAFYEQRLNSEDTWGGVRLWAAIETPVPV